MDKNGSTRSSWRRLEGLRMEGRRMRGMIGALTGLRRRLLIENNDFLRVLGGERARKGLAGRGEERRARKEWELEGSVREEEPGVGLSEELHTGSMTLSPLLCVCLSVCVSICLCPSVCLSVCAHISLESSRAFTLRLIVAISAQATALAVLTTRCCDYMLL